MRTGPSPFRERDLKVRFVYTGIRVRNMQESVDFYTKVLGMKVTGSSEIPAANGQVVNLESEGGGAQLELNYYHSGSRYSTPYSAGEELDHLAFEVEEIDSFLERAEKAGYPVVAEIKTEKSRWVYIQDPNGIWIEIVK